MTYFAIGFRAEWRGRDAIPHNSPFLAHAWYLMDESILQIVAAGRLPGQLGHSWNGRFPLPVPARCRAILRRVRAGSDEFRADLTGELLNSASIMALQMYFWPSG
jgi:hypothetical protein